VLQVPVPSPELLQRGAAALAALLGMAAPAGNNTDRLEAPASAFRVRLLVAVTGIVSLFTRAALFPASIAVEADVVIFCRPKGWRAWNRRRVFSARRLQIMTADPTEAWKWRSGVARWIVPLGPRGLPRPRWGAGPVVGGTRPLTQDRPGFPAAATTGRHFPPSNSFPTPIPLAPFSSHPFPPGWLFFFFRFWRAARCQMTLCRIGRFRPSLQVVRIQPSLPGPEGGSDSNNQPRHPPRGRRGSPNNEFPN